MSVTGLLCYSKSGDGQTEWQPLGVGLCPLLLLLRQRRLRRRPPCDCGRPARKPTFRAVALAALRTIHRLAFAGSPNQRHGSLPLGIVRFPMDRVAVTRPSLHQLSSLIEQIASPVGGFSLVR